MSFLNIPNSDTNSITQLTGDVTAVGTGSVSAAVAFVGGSSAANVHLAELAANAATSSGTNSTIVKRDGSGKATVVVNYTAGTSGDWASTPPTTVAAALDRMASLLAVLNAGPIP